MKTLVEFSQQPAVHALGWSLLHFLWQGTLVAVLLAGALAMLRGKSPQLRYLVACCALILMLALPLVTWRRLAAQPQIVAIELSTNYRPAPNFPTGWTGNVETWQDRLAREADQSVPLVLSIWFAGVILLWSRLNIGLIAAWRMKYSSQQPASVELQLLLQKLSRHLGITRPINLVNSAVVEVPTVIGWLRPVILVPMGCLVGLSAGQIEALLAHELAHIRRHDYLVNILQSVVETLLFYHPATWWISRQIRREREHCCDDLAVSICGDPLSYAKALSFLAERHTALPATALGASGGSLAARIRRLLLVTEPSSVSRAAATTLLTVLFLALGVGVGAVVRAQSKSSEPPAVVSSEGAQSLPSKYQQWLSDEVPYIIAGEERAAFKKLTTDQEREAFIEKFWERRNPNPGSAENAFKEEYYRRIAFANSHYQGIHPGWKTDRGRIYIMYGPPDEIDSHPAKDKPQAGFTYYSKPTEFWRYRSIRESARPQQVTVDGRTELKAQTSERLNVEFEFVDLCRCGDYRLESPPKN